MINNPDYRWYVVVERDGIIYIESGWEYREDAKEHITGNQIQGGRVFHLRTCKFNDLNPDNDRSWLT